MMLSSLQNNKRKGSSYPSLKQIKIHTIEDRQLDIEHVFSSALAAPSTPECNMNTRLVGNWLCCLSGWVLDDAQCVCCSVV